jgi:hypothetical protein
MKIAVFWDIKTQFVPYRKHITSPPVNASSQTFVILMMEAMIHSSEMSVLTRAPRRNITEDGNLHK